MEEMTSKEQYDLAMDYYNGTNDCEKDLEAAFYWFAGAAGLGDLNAEVQIGHMLASGEGTEQDLEEAALCYFVAADLGHEEAKKEFESVKEYLDLDSVEIQNKLGYSYYFRHKTEKSIYWFTKASEQGDGNALFMIGQIYRLTDIEKALDYYHKAYEKGSEDAACYLGNAYEKGEGVEVDYAKALKYYTFAAEKSCPPALACLASMYEEGRGTEKNPKLAQFYRHIFKIIEDKELTGYY